MSEFITSPKNKATTEETRREALSRIREGADKMLRFCEVFTALQAMFHDDTDADKTLSGDARCGLVYMFKLLADDAIEELWPLLKACEALSDGEGGHEER